MNLPKLCMLIVVVVLFGSLSWGQNPTATPINVPFGSAIVSDLKGEVLVTASQTTASIPAQKSQILGPNTLIETKKGNALLTLGDGSQVLIKPNTRVILRLPDEAKGNFLEQLIGRVVAKITKRAIGQPPFKMGTPSAVITVRGTHFEVEVNRKQKTFVQVYEGSVQVESLGGMGSPVILQPGFTTGVGVRTPPEDPRRKLDPEDIAGEGTFSNSKRRESEQRGTSNSPQSPTSNNGGEPE
jgi:ferric-dicitrate binding protein FerR (iron transport regulator)